MGSRELKSYCALEEATLELLKFAIAIYYGPPNSPYAEAAAGLGYAADVAAISAAYAAGGSAAAAAAAGRAAEMRSSAASSWATETNHASYADGIGTLTVKGSLEQRRLGRVSEASVEPGGQPGVRRPGLARALNVWGRGWFC